MAEAAVRALLQQQQQQRSPGWAASAVRHVRAVLEERRAARALARTQDRDAFSDAPLFHACRDVLDAAEPHLQHAKDGARSEVSLARRLLLFEPNTGVKHYIAELAQRDLLRDAESHPLGMLAGVVRGAFPDFAHFGPSLNPVVSTTQCFDDLLTPPDHISRSPTDTFYVSPTHVLRTHTSAHQTQFLRAGVDKFLVSADVYRRDTIDATHFPVFHQMEGVKVMPPGATTLDAFHDLKANLDRLTDVLFGPHVPRKWIDAYFPFTEPSLELEIDFHGKNVEVLGCGVVHASIMRNCELSGRTAWAFGLGLERLAMILFDIPDIRLFWSEDKRFLGQFVNCRQAFRENRQIKFQPYSKFPPSRRDVSFWMYDKNFHVHDFYSIVRAVAADDVEEVSLTDEFVHPQTGEKSYTFNIVFRSNSITLPKALTKQRVDDICTKLASEYKLKLR